MTRIKIFKQAHIRNMIEGLVTGETLHEYFEPESVLPDGCEWESTVEFDGEKIELDLGEEGCVVEKDLNNSIKLYESMKGMTGVQASDSRLWTHMTHVELRDYVQKRWPLKVTLDEINKMESLKKRTTSFILEHWFVNGTDRALRRNAVARLWWAVHLTTSPWEQFPERFADLHTSDDPYKYTRTIYETQDIFQQVLERGLGREPIILVSILDCIERNKEADKLPTRKEVRFVMKELNLMSGIKNLALMPQNELRELLENLFKQSKNQT